MIKVSRARASNAIVALEKKSISPTDFADLRADGCEVVDRTLESAGLKDLVAFSVHVFATMPSDTERSDVFIEARTFF